MRSAGFVHYHLISGGLLDAIECELGQVLPFVRTNTGDICFQADSSESVIFNFGLVLMAGHPDREPATPSVPEIVDVDAFAKAIILVARKLAEPSADPISIEAGVYYTLATLAVLLSGHRLDKLIPYRNVWFDVQGRVLLVEAIETTDQATLDAIVAKLKTLDALVFSESGSHAFHFFPSTVMQVALERDGSPIRDAVHKRLIGLAGQDGEYLRTDKFVQGIIDDETAKQREEDAHRTSINGVITVLLKELRLPGSATTNIVHHKGMPDLSGSEKVTVNVMPLDGKPDTFAILVSGSDNLMLSDLGVMTIDVAALRR